VTFGKNFVDVGLDIKNERTLKIVNKKIYKKVVIYDGKKITFKDDYFQTVISNCVLEHLPKLEISLKEINRVLKKNRYFLTTVMTDRWIDFMLGKKLFGKIYVSFMNKKQEHLLDLFHYFSIPSFFTHKIFGLWVLFPSWYKFLRVDKFFERKISFPSPQNSAAVFFVLRKV